MARLTGKVAIITGGAGGIGTAAAKLFTDEGARVLLVDRNESALQRVVDTLGGAVASYAVADVTQPAEVQGYVQTALERYQGIDILLANAGVEGVIQPITDYPVDVFDQVMAVNVRGVWLGLKYAIPALRAGGGGSIIITSSTAGIHGAVVGAWCERGCGVVTGVRSHLLISYSLPIRQPLDNGSIPEDTLERSVFHTAVLPHRPPRHRLRGVTLFWGGGTCTIFYKF